ncbi:MAG: calcium/sodium antiporter, partial [Gammaproteobacteria bacterium]|nr:calcium/sodium antiporter [Gammaproteobacteria bacterium]
MVLSIIYVLLGFVLLTFGADRFVTGAIATARNVGISQLLIGLTVVGFATSAPEMLVSATAAWGNNPGVGVGNAIGSNITNVGLVLGVTALVRPLHVHSNIIRKEFVLMFMALGLSLFMLFDLELTVTDGLVLLAGLATLMSVMVIMGKRQQMPDQLTDEMAATAEAD